jgi:hypothetical protein
MMLAASATDSVEPLVTDIGSVIFHADIKPAEIRRTPNSNGGGYDCGRDWTIAIPPPSTTTAT